MSDLTRTNPPEHEEPGQPEQVAEQDIPTRTFTPNWKRNGFKSKEDAMRYAILLTIDRVPGAVVTYRGKTYDSERVKTTGLKLVPLI